MSNSTVSGGIRYFLKRDLVTGRYNQHLEFVPIDDVPSAFTSLCDEIPPELS